MKPYGISLMGDNAMSANNRLLVFRVQELPEVQG
jgi:hypothetical protein